VVAHKVNKERNDQASLTKIITSNPTTGNL
jgi:hypothetical protein